MTPTIEEVKRVADTLLSTCGSCGVDYVCTIKELQAFAQHWIEVGEKNADADANRWRYTQQPGYFVCGPYSTDGDFMGYSVGVEPEIPPNLHWKERSKYGGVNKWIQGHGETLQDAIDEAISNNTGE